ncbi:M48 family metalloprotease [Marinoscillum sp.]|uniref:M48 family metalloprotease n=1 Tax=Marinoscillum sp. TaxID=2024838 RepID=UPI003BAA321D
MITLIKRAIVFVLCTIFQTALPLFFFSFVALLAVGFFIDVTMLYVFVTWGVISVVWVVLSLLSVMFTPIVIRFYGGRRLLESERELLLPAIEEVAQEVDYLKGIYLSVIDENMEANAFVIGHYMVFHSALIQSTSADELRGVIAHEYAHMKYRDSYFSSVRSTLQIPMIFLIKILDSIVGFCKGFPPLMIIGLPFLLVLLPLQLITFLINLIVLSISRYEEYRADWFSATHGFKDGLMSFLHKMSQRETKKSWIEGVLDTHPSSPKRILKLESVFN